MFLSYILDMYACMYWIQSMRVQLREWMLHTSNPGFSMNGELWCHAALLHIDCIYLNAISIIDDHYSFSLKSVREKLLQTPRKQQQMSCCDDAARNRKMLFLFLCHSVEWSETTAAATQLLKNLQHSLFLS